MGTYNVPSIPENASLKYDEINEEYKLPKEEVQGRIVFIAGIVFVVLVAIATYIFYYKFRDSVSFAI
jgi:hypothetical protein